MTFGPGMYQQVAGPCETCNGQGEVLEEASKCKRCEGKKIVEEKKEIDVIVDPGVPENYEYIFANEGDQYVLLIIIFANFIYLKFFCGQKQKF